MRNPEQHKRMQKFVRNFSAQRGFPLPEDPDKNLVWYTNCNDFLFDIIDAAWVIYDQINDPRRFCNETQYTNALNDLTTHCVELSSIGAAAFASRFGLQLLHDVASDNPITRQRSEAGLRIIKDAAAKGHSETSFGLYKWYKHQAPKNRMGREANAKRYLTQAAMNNHRMAAYIFARGVSSGYFVVPKDAKDEITLGWFTQALAKEATGSLNDRMVSISLKEMSKLVASPAIDPKSNLATNAQQILHRYTAG